MKVLQRFNLNFESAVMTVVGILALLAAAAKPWWNLLGFKEPLYFKLDRLICAVMALVIAYCVFTARRTRVTVILAVSLAAMLLPFLSAFWLITHDAKSIVGAVEQFNSTLSIISATKQGEANIEVPWAEGTQLTQYVPGRNDYTYSDAVGTMFHFLQPGFLIALAAGICLMVAAWTMNAPAAAVAMRRVGLRAAIFVAVFVVAAMIPIAVGFAEWNLGRKYQSVGQYSDALVHYRRAAIWDKRIDYDIFYHYNLGRLDAALQRRDDPDYWAWVGDNYYRASKVELAGVIYEEHITNPNANPALAYRYSRMMASVGAHDYNLGSFGLADRRITQSLEFDPNSLLAAYEMAILKTEERDYPAAIREWKAIIINNESVGMYRSKYFTSNLVYRKALTARAWSHLAWCYYQINDLPDAMASLTNSNTAGKMPLPTMDSAPIQTWTHS